MRARMTAGFVLFMMVVVVAGTVTLAILLEYIARTHAAARLDSAFLSAQAILVQHSENTPGKMSLLKVVRENQSEIAGYGVAILVVDNKKHVLWRSQKNVPHWPQPSEPWRWRSLKLNNEELVLGIPWKNTEVELVERSWAMIALGALVMLGTALGAWWVVGRTLSPIGALARQVRHASTEDLQVRLQPPSQDAEIVELVSTLNDLLKYMGEEALMRSRFYAIASHELRTPLQALSGHLELSLSRGRSNEEYRNVLQESLGQTQRLILLVQALLQLYQIENKALPQQIKVSLNGIIDDQLALLRSWMGRRELRLQPQVEEVQWMAPPGHFEIVVRNLLENAVKYSRRGCAIKIDLQHYGTKVLLRVCNECDLTGTASAPAAKTDANDEMSSYGLGMTICQAIADANGWSLQVLRQDGIMTVDVWLDKTEPRNNAKGAFMQESAVEEHANSPL